MSLATLAEVKSQLRIATSNTTADSQLTQILRGVSGAIRQHVKSYLGGVLTSNSVASPSVVNAPGHGLQSGDIIVVGGSDSTPTIDGQRTVTRIDPDNFSVPVNVTVAGTLGYWSKIWTEYYSGSGTNRLALRQRPVIEMVSLLLDQTGYFGQNPNGAFDEDTTELVEGTDFVLKRDNANQDEQSKSGIVLRIGTYWPRPAARTKGLLAGTPGDALGNIKATYQAGFMPIQDIHRMACCEYVKTIWRGPEYLSETYDYYTYTLAPAADRENLLGSVRDLLGDIKKWVW